MKSLEVSIMRISPSPSRGCSSWWRRDRECYQGKGSNRGDGDGENEEAVKMSRSS